ncbi:MAG TPA: LAGLIDADG family homing endonuclease, partial [Nakamurella sp.]
LQGTLAHRVKVVEPRTGKWVWKRLADIEPGDLVPLQLGQTVGDSREVPLPVLDQAYYAGDRHTQVPNTVDAELAELVGYFMGDGSLHAKGIRLCVADADADVVERLRVLSKGLFALDPVVRPREGYQEVTLQSVRLARWWKAAGFAEDLPGVDHSGKGWTPRVPTAVRETNDPAIYAAFLRGLFEADGTVLGGVPNVSTASETFADDIRALLLLLGVPTTTRQTVSGWGGPQFQVRIRNLSHARGFAARVGFLGGRKQALVDAAAATQSGIRDRIQLPDEVWRELAPVGHELRSLILQAVARGRGVSRDLALQLQQVVADPRLAHALGYVFESVAANVDGGVQPTYDLSVPSNVTYVAAGFVSHNTIGLMMDCDTTGVEPDLALVKFKKLVGGGSMQIVNQTVPRALKALGYQPESIEAVVEYIADHGHVVDAPGLRREHYSVFDCAMGERSIAPMGHVRMMAAVQPFISGAISKTVNMPEHATVQDVAEIYQQGWKLGLKALAIYRDNCKVGQPLSASNKNHGEKSADASAVDTPAPASPATPVVTGPVRRRLPKKRPSQTVSFTVGGAEGYLTTGSYPDDGLGEVFIKLGKQGSTLAGVMDAFSIAVSVGLQYGIPLESYVAKFTNLRFEPAGMTDDPDVRIATSVMDYLFRRIALDYLPVEARAELGIFSAEERRAQVASKYGSDSAGPGGPDNGADDGLVENLRTTVDATPVIRPAVESGSAAPVPAGARDTGKAGSSTELLELVIGKSADAPLCFTCGTKMRPSGACYLCEGCGSTSGCS